MDYRRRSLLALSAAFGAGCVSAPSLLDGTTTSEPTPTRGTPADVPDDILDALVKGTTRFALDLHRELVSKSSDENLFQSPYSIALALAMTWAGAREETAEKMAKTLHFDQLDDDVHPAFSALVADLTPENTGENEPFTLRTANALWGQEDYPFDQAFLDLLATHYAARMHEVDYAADPPAARQLINDWVEEKTEGKIEDLLPPGVLSGATKLVLTNAIYFNAVWRQPFEEANTDNSTFTNLDGSSTTIPMMTQTESFPYAEIDGMQVIELPYRGGASMVVALPVAGSFESFEQSLDGESVSALAGKLEHTAGSISFPKFSVESAFSLKDTLSALGMDIAFDAARANFDGMVAGDGPSGLFITDAIHKSFVAVDEKGTEAAAATAVIMDETAVAEEEFEMVVDRPFVFFIRDQETGTILFSGRVVDAESALE